MGWWIVIGATVMGINGLVPHSTGAFVYVWQGLGRRS